jgi:hypothetical protein
MAEIHQEAEPMTGRVQVIMDLIFPAGKIAPGKINQLTITASGIFDSLGRPLDGNKDGQPGGNLVAKVGRSSVTIV